MIWLRIISIFLPFNDCIYSFLEKKTFSYGELPNIHFKYKINRNLVKYNCLTRLIMMMLWIGSLFQLSQWRRRPYNARLKTRALAGYYHDKKWYGYCSLNLKKALFINLEMNEVGIGCWGGHFQIWSAPYHLSNIFAKSSAI